MTAAWGALYPWTWNNFNTAGYTSLSFWAQASAAGESFDVSLVDPTNTMIKLVPMASYGGALQNGTWVHYTIPLSALNGTNITIMGFVVQEDAGPGAAHRLLRRHAVPIATAPAGTAQRRAKPFRAALCCA